MDQVVFRHYRFLSVKASLGRQNVMAANGQKIQSARRIMYMLILVIKEFQDNVSYYIDVILKKE